jgi:hypothetical protein
MIDYTYIGQRTQKLQSIGYTKIIMKRSIQFAGLFGCGAFALLTFTIFIYTQLLDRIVWVSIPGAMLAGFCGYHIGYNFDNPRRRRKRKIIHLPAPPSSDQDTALPNDAPS